MKYFVYQFDYILQEIYLNAHIFIYYLKNFINTLLIKIQLNVFLNRVNN